MAFLAPAFLLALGALAVPVLVHLIQRERSRVVLFPSLMFVRRIPYQSVRRRRIRHWFLLAMRAVALALIVAAFARPFVRQGAAAAAVTSGGRELVVLLDRSASMGYGDHWQHARTAARAAVSRIGAADKATLVLFDRNAEETIRATSDHGRLESAIEAARVGSGATRYGPALKLAESILARSALAHREVTLISDFQKSGWTGAEDVHFPASLTLTPVSVAAPTTNVSIPSVTFARSTFAGQERVAVTAGVTNRNAALATALPVTLEVDGHVIESQPLTIPPNASGAVSFKPFTLTEPQTRGVVRAGSDPLPVDNAFYFVATPSAAVSVLVVTSGDLGDPTFYLSRALAIGTAPAFSVETVPAARATAAMLDKVAVLVLNDTPVPSTLSGAVLRRFVERGGGVLVALGGRSTWPTADADLLPGRVGAPVDRTSGRGGTIGFRDYSHPVFEVFKAPRSGDFSAVRVQRYRALDPAPSDRVLARYDDGAVTAGERRIGSGRVIAWTTSLDDSWSDLALKPVYLPLVHQLIRYLAKYELSVAWSTVGQVLDLSTAFRTQGDRVIVTPSGRNVRVAASEPGLLELDEQGIFEVRAAGMSAAARPDRLAVNLDPAESDLTPLDPRELAAAVTGRAMPGLEPRTAQAPPTREEAERRMGLWWYLLLAGLALLVAENVVANRLSRGERFL